MTFRIANMQDLPALKSTFHAITEQMNKNGINIWNDIYPYEVFAEDISNSRLYLLTEGKTIVAAFALCKTSSGEKAVRWEDPDARALYIYRFAVNPIYSGKGYAKHMLQKARETAREKGASYLRLFVVDINIPAINLYVGDGFSQVDGINIERINNGPELREFGYEVKL